MVLDRLDVLAIAASMGELDVGYVVCSCGRDAAIGDFVEATVNSFSRFLLDSVFARLLYGD